jgi:hypothetical protein
MINNTVSRVGGMGWVRMMDKIIFTLLDRQVLVPVPYACTAVAWYRNMHPNIVPKNQSNKMKNRK